MIDSKEKTEFSFLGVENNQQVIAGRDLTWWVENYKLPVHISYAPVIRRNLRNFKDVFSRHYPKGKVRYAVKACAHPEILKIVREEGVGADASSFNEARCAQDSGISPSEIDLNGNFKGEEIIADAVEKGILIIADSLEECEIIHRFCRKNGARARVILRLSGFNLGKVTADAVFTAGVWTKFGFPVNDVPIFLDKLKEMDSLDFLGFHTHIGSQVADVEPYLAVFGKMIEAGRMLRERGIECRIINMGGGFPVSYLNENEWNKLVEQVRRGYISYKNGDTRDLVVWNNRVDCFDVDAHGEPDLSKWTGEKFYSPYPKEKMLEALLTGDTIVEGKTLSVRNALKSLGDPELMVEPGRSIAEDAGITLVRAGLTKTIAGCHHMLSLEMGVTSLCDSLLEPSIRHCEVANDLDRMDSVPFEAFASGNLCFSGDMIFKYKISLQRKPETGDIIMIRDTGAYSSSFMPANSNSFPRPARVLAFEDGKVIALKKRDEYRDIYS